MKVENINFLRNHYRYIRDMIQQTEEELQKEQIKVVESKTGLPTLQVTINNQEVYLHSKYDPVKEAEKLVEQYEKDIDQYDHIFFYGIGLGYHVEKFMEKYRDKKFSIYEPKPAIFYHYMKNRTVEKLPLKQMSNLFVEWSQEMGTLFLSNFADGIKGNVLLVLYPAYSRLFPKEYEQFLIEFKNRVQQKRMSYSADYSFANRWTLNSLMNIVTTIETPNLLVDKKEVFKDKPVLIVSAGPSLGEEYDNLRYIKENRLAYILAVGSANKALVANGILPDAVCTYDPQEHNFNVFKPLIENNIETIPMIYGSSVGYETILKYKGPKLHVITTQDTVTPYYFEYNTAQIEMVDDSFSIAIITFQILAKMRAGLIVLVGQNFAFHDNLFYSKEITRRSGSAEVQDKDLINELSVRDVHGNMVKTNVSFNQMRLILEHYIQSYNSIEVINTTKGGASISGTSFLPLEKVIEQKLTTKVVEEYWFKSEQVETKDHFFSQVDKMELAIEHFILLYNSVFSVLNEFKQAIERNKIKKLYSLFPKFDKAFNIFTLNNFYSVYIRPISRIEYDYVYKSIVDIREMTDPKRKAEIVINTFGTYLNKCRTVYNKIAPIVQNVHSKFKMQNVKRYTSDCGVFQYSEGWENINTKFESILYKYFITTRKGSTIKFSFKGSGISLLGGSRYDTSDKIKILIDGHEQIVSTKNKKRDEKFIFNFNHCIYSIQNLKDEEHSVEIELLDDEKFVFFGVEISDSDRLYHIDEVTSVEELKIGKRIRCHYQATFNTSGKFSNLGGETKEFIPTESSDYPDGDFYYICCDSNENNGCMLIADRVIQTNISWERLNEAAYTKGKPENAIHERAIIRILTSGYLYKDIKGNPTSEITPYGSWPIENEFDKYIVESDLNGNIIPGSKFTWNWGVFSWTNTSPLNDENKEMDETRKISRSHPSHVGSTRGFGKPPITFKNNFHGFRPTLIIK